MTSLPILYIVVPCYNEEEVLPETTSRLIEVLQNLINQKKIALQSKIMFVDDGSKDRTWEIIQALNDKQDFVTGLKLARNAGHQNALLAGLMTAKSFSDCVISIDADLQDDVNAIYEFIQKYHEGYDIVYGVRQSRTTDTFFKRFTAESFYRLMKTMGVNLVFNHADYRLMSKRTLENLADFQEVNLFIRGIVPLLGYKSTEVYYDRNERFAGESKYPLKKMLAFAFDGISSFSVTPIRLVTTAGFMIFGLSILAGIYAIIAKILGMTVTGWASIILSVWFLGGVQLIALGLIGEYVGKIYKEVKARPKFIIEKHLESKEITLNFQS
ncbi:glycosyltransferase family 2 protein [Paenibacillus mucilaginosus]|uniref:YkoT n=1 Tax=Paenibacillus mucilaginosus (strain KNP414) TaxID=1036673 RepID=F8FQH7_PAEMK|nr:glycosyltransferase family 2 protein [Paenibacillus mucilaginosus]AEI39238.1 YkoT [Paenibacillus mucilaginosus KNP414]MCG7217121.1 glycosyltransferase family 2 protein [Paenibacillus mucilaginosus]WDM28245.1 glycosyltransferase family 2 protein [Paenibacillus mucilaginosus]